MPWYWFAVLIGIRVGMSVGALVAGYRTTPLLDGPVRTVDPVRRRVPQHFALPDVLRLRLAVLVAVAASVLTGVIAASEATTSARRSVVACGVALLLVLAQYAVAAVLIARPMVASTPEGLLWQKALLASTVRPMPGDTFLVAMASAAIALVATFLDRGDLPLPVLLLGAGVALAAVASSAATTLGDRNRKREQYPQADAERAAS